MSTLLPMNKMGPVRRVNLTSQVMESIKSFIITNKLTPGSKLPSEKELMVRLQVSRNILREALKSLEALGLIEIKVGDGMYVSTFDYSSVVTHISFALSQSEQELEHFIQARLIIEVGAVDIVVERVTDEDIQTLEECNKQIGLAETVEDFAQADLEFHRQLLSISGNPILSEFGSFLGQFFAEAQQRVGQEAKFHTAKGHEEMMTALRNHDAERLRMEMRRHILTWKPSK